MLFLTLSLLACTGGDADDRDTADTDTDTADTDTDTADTDTDTDTADTDTDTADTDTDTDTDTADTDTADTPEARGAALYEADCATCHGADGTGVDGAPDLTQDVPRLSDEEIIDVVRNGKEDMPAFTYDEAQMSDLLAFLRATFP